jgi:RNA polymerase sigma-70 factor (ECF subfamily)
MENLETLALAVPVRDNIVLESMTHTGKDATPGRERESDLAGLIQAGVRGDHSALEQIYHRFKTPLYNLAYRYTLDAAAAEDILQEVFIKVFTHLGDITNADTFPAWIYRVAVNASLSYLRVRKRERQKSVPLASIEGRLEEASYDADTSHLRRPIEDAVQTLSERLQSVFLLHDVQGFKHEEIAGILGCSTGTSKSYLFKARMKIRKQLKTKAIEASS